MMRHRERALARRRSKSRTPLTKLLGGVDEVRARAPFVVNFGGGPFWIAVLDDVIIAHATTCPHWLGPLDGATIVDGCIRCPWHGYRFDIRTGASVDGHGLKLHPAPNVVIKDGTVSLRRA
jgi:nitrite reductase/ring-hydroxylating ferredoxin subunit